MRKTKNKQGRRRLFVKNKQGRSRLFVKNKQGQGHIEMILSFIIFIGFLLFIFIFLNPFAKSDSNKIMGRIQESVLKDIRDDIGKLSVIVPNVGDCYYFDSSTYPGKYIEVKDLNEPRKFIIYFNDIFSDSAPNRNAGCLAQYSLGTYSKENMIIYEKIQDLRTKYTTDYDGLKTSLGILNEFDFELKKISGEVEISVDKKSPVGVEREAVNIPMRVINSNGIISEYILKIRAW